MSAYEACAALEHALDCSGCNVAPPQRGTLSMARFDDPDSGTSSFSILLGNATHLNSKYTIFGAMLDGDDVLDKASNELTMAMTMAPCIGPACMCISACVHSTHPCS